MKRRAFLSTTATAAATLVAGMGMIGSAQVASADDGWCDVDPPIYIRTATGETVVLHVTMYCLGAQHLPAVEAATITYDSSPNRANPRDTDVSVQVFIPGDQFDPRFAVKSTVSALEFAEGTVYSQVSGTSGVVMQHRFVLPAADVKGLEQVASSKRGTIGPAKVRASRSRLTR